jgi:hypothetical protein
MGELSLSAWIATAGVGLSLLGIFLGRGGAHQPRQARGRLRPRLVFSHIGVAVVGLCVWVAYLITKDKTLAWLALSLLCLVAILGATEYYVWQKRRLGRIKATAASWDLPSSTLGAGEIPPEQHFPVSVVLLHGVFAVITLVLVTLATLGVEDWASFRDKFSL